MSQKLPQHEFEQLIKNAPLISIDLLVRTKDGKLLLGRRNSEPAKNFFFVPGGRIFKDERMEDAFSRLTTEELGVKMAIADAYSLGVHQHFYPTNATGKNDFGTHYVVLAYELHLDEELRDLPKSQHSEYRWMTAEEARRDEQVHPNSRAYLESDKIRLDLQYKIIAERRIAQDSMLWQTPALVFTAEAFLFSVVASKEAETPLKFFISLLGLSIAFASLQLLVKHRSLEVSDSRLLEQFEIRNTHRGYARTHYQMLVKDSDVAQNNLCGKYEPWPGLANMSSFDIWRVVMSLTVVMFLGLTIYWGHCWCN